MSKTFIPNTTVEAQILQPASPSGFVSLFMANGETGNGNYMASVNAGTSNAGAVFEVGLGGINGAFANTLTQAGQQVNQYQQIHQDLFNQAGSALELAQSTFAATDPVGFSLIQKPSPGFNLPDYDGIVFLDVFQVNQLPHGNSLNAAMLYLVPPFNNGVNYANDASFLLAIQASSQTIVSALHSYNTQYASQGNKFGLNPIANIRMCLFSGGIYRGNATVSDVAKANLKGLELGLNDPSNANHGITLVEFEFADVAPWLSSGS